MENDGENVFFTFKKSHKMIILTLLLTIITIAHSKGANKHTHMDIMTANVKDRLDREQRRCVLCTLWERSESRTYCFDPHSYSHFFNKIDIHTTQLASTASRTVRAENRKVVLVIRI